MLKNVIYQAIIHSFESVRKTRASKRHLLLQNKVSHGVNGGMSFLRWKDVTYTCQYATQYNYLRDFLSAMAESWKKPKTSNVF